ncbi:MAG: ATP-dependent DNA helicase [Clostridiales bacterium]|nr:ATP-dependent DNA helicase [Clostridiales bacterium]
METFKDDKLKISVRNLVEFVLRTGDIDNRYSTGLDTEAMVAGGKIHRKIQSRMGANYAAEVALRCEIFYEKFSIIVDGRADGIISGEIVTVDEIKGVKRDIEYIKEPMQVHLAQAMCYAYIYGNDNKLETIRVQMTYVNLETEEIKRFIEEYTMEYLSNWFHMIVDEYYKWAEYLYENKVLVEGTSKQLQFPYDYRSGQRDVTVNTYRAIKRKVDLYIQAPTGVGKTMSTVFPAIKAIGEGLGEKIFYLTAKTITGSVAQQAFNTLRDHGLHFKSISITAKDKMCVMEETKCNPEYCERAKGHYDRINEAIFDIISNESDITREVILNYATKHNICPFEFCLDISNWVDGIICDYNYAFDPSVRLKRYFGESSENKYIFLVDEAHNLVDRAREMYSATIVKEDVLAIKKLFTGKDKRITGNLEKLNKVMLSYKRMCVDGFMLLPTIDEMSTPMLRYVAAMEKYMEEHSEYDGKDEAMDFYFCAKTFLNTIELLDENYEIYCEIDDRGDFFVKLMCVNPSGRLSMCMESAVSTIFFSATLLPVGYYKKLLSGNENDYAIYIDSPFSKDNRQILIGTDVTSKYTRRNDAEYEKIARYIIETISAKEGNYMVFFPSYRLMENIYEVIDRMNISKFCDLIVQNNGMTEIEREEFLNKFDENNPKTLLAMCVMGGIFSEGIDLKNDRLIGTIIVGTGLPQICKEREIISDYFQDQGLNGFDYAYRYPGMNKVLQAAGRVIRTEEDMGVIVLLDERFRQSGYRALYPREWDDVENVTVDHIARKIDDFWNRKS